MGEHQPHPRRRGDLPGRSKEGSRTEQGTVLAGAEHPRILDSRSPPGLPPSATVRLPPPRPALAEPHRHRLWRRVYHSPLTRFSSRHRSPPALSRVYTPYMAKKRKSPSADPAVTFHGAARTVTGSMHLLDACGQSLLLDCGLFQGSRAETFRHNREFPFRVKDIDAVVLSHAHIDHCGNLPNLIKQGFTGPIYCTSATRALVAVMLGDAAKIQEEDAEYLNRKRAKGEPKIEPL